MPAPTAVHLRKALIPISVGWPAQWIARIILILENGRKKYMSEDFKRPKWEEPEMMDWEDEWEDDRVTYTTTGCFPSTGKACSPQCNPNFVVCSPRCRPKCNPSCRPTCHPTCNPTCSPTCRPRCNPSCYPTCSPRNCFPYGCRPRCRPFCSPTACYPSCRPRMCNPACSPPG